MKRYYIFAVVLALTAVIPAHASLIDTVEYTGNFSTYSNAYTRTTGSQSSASQTNRDTVSVQGFDTGLGTLTGVEIGFTSRWYQGATLDGADYDSETGSYTDRHREHYSCGPFGWFDCHRYRTETHYYRDNDTWAFAYASSRLAVALLDPLGSRQVSIASTRRLSCANSFSRRSSPSNVYCSDMRGSGGYRAFNGVLDLTGIDLASFVKSSADAIDLAFDNSSAVNLWCDNNDYGDRCVTGSSQRWNGNVTVRYSYEKAQAQAQVPEPGVVALLGAGLLVMGMSRRRKSVR